MAETEALYTIAEVALKLRVNEITIRRLIQKRQLSAMIIGRQFRISESQVKAYLDRNTIQPVEKK